MTLSDSMFLFEVAVDDLKSYIDCKEFKIIGSFSDFFELNLKDPKDVVTKKLEKKKRGKANIRRKKRIEHNSKVEKVNPQSRQSVLLIKKVHWVIANMKKYPIELSLWSKTVPKYKMGSTVIPWNTCFVDYLYNIHGKKNAPVVVEDIYNIFDEVTSKCMAAIKISIKLIHLDDNFTSEFNCVSEMDLNTFFYNSSNFNRTTFLNTIKQSDQSLIEYGSIKSIHDGKINRSIATLQNKKMGNTKVKQTRNDVFKVIENKTSGTNQVGKYLNETKNNSLINRYNDLTIKGSLSNPNINIPRKYKTLDYVFGDPDGPKPNRMYCVGYFTVERDKSSSISKVASSPSVSTKTSQSATNSKEQKQNITLKKCRSECLDKDNNPSFPSVYSIDLPTRIADLAKIIKCKDIKCDNRSHRNSPDPPNDAILLDLTNLKKKCCNRTEKIENVVGKLSAKLKMGEDPCFCTCECKFGFTKHTTYCNICGGYEKPGEDLARKVPHEIPIPCPIYHKLFDKSKLKTYSTSGSESKRKSEDNQKIMKTSSSQKAVAADKKMGLADKKSIELEKDSKKNKKKKIDDRFKFNYGYKAPQIGHSKCALPCSGTLGNVPKNMGWLWTAEDLPGMKFRPMWKPGAVNKHVLRLLRIARNPGEVTSKKRRKDTGKKKRPLKRPLLIVHKKDGEYTVTMETMKTYTRTRAINQHPYEDKPVVTYTIGRTEEENRDRRKKKERTQRRLERAQRMFIQSAFKDMCHEICLKTYQQALGILPDTEELDCTCYPALPTAENINLDVSCSCSEKSSSNGSDTDSDEWIVEFTPPNALFDPAYKGKKYIKADSETQYSYLDYKVKLLDRFGNTSPRFFKGPDGKQQCSDLGGFWSPDNKWLEINVDGFIAPDGRWAPNNFTGPSGEQVDAETGKFQATNGKWLVVGIDGYVDVQSKWRFYPKPSGAPTKPKRYGYIRGGEKSLIDGKKEQKAAYKSETSWSCFGDASPRQLSKLGITGHGQDKKLLISTLQDMLARGENVELPKSPLVFSDPQKGKKSNKPNTSLKISCSYLKKRTKCHHPVPSQKGIVAVDSDGNKTYFHLKDLKNKRPNERLAALADQGISLSSFHVPCLNSFINSEIMKKQLRDRILMLASNSTATQVSLQ